MAVGADSQWWLRLSGDDANGGGYDSTISGAGTNYANQDSAQLSLTDLATSGAASTTLTSATGGFTAAMVGNAIRIPSGTNFDAGYYFITVYTDTNTVTLDRSPTSAGAGSGGTGKVGGAWASINMFASQGTSTLPTITTPVIAGNTCWIQGSGSNDPASEDYQGTASGYLTWKGGSASYYVTYKGFDGRPWITINSFLYNSSASHRRWENFRFVRGGSTSSYALITGDLHSIAEDVEIDCNGSAAEGIRCGKILNCRAFNSGATTSGSAYAFRATSYGGQIVGCWIDNWCGPGMKLTNTGEAVRNIVNECQGYGIYLTANTASYGGAIVDGNVIRSGTTDGIKCVGHKVTFSNNIIELNGGYGINLDRTAAENDRSVISRNNAFRSNTSGDYNNFSGDDSDVTLTADPFTDAASDDYTLNSDSGAGSSCKGAGYPSTIVGQSNNIDIGAIQSAAASGGDYNPFRNRQGAAT